MILQGYYAVILGSSYGDETEIQYFNKKITSGTKRRVLKENDLDSGEKCELKKVIVAIIIETIIPLVTIKLHRNFH